MKFAMRLWRHPNGIYYAELERNRRRSLGTRDKTLAQRLYRKLKTEFLLNKVAFLEGRYHQSRTLRNGDVVYVPGGWEVEIIVHPLSHQSIPGILLTSHLL